MFAYCGNNPVNREDPDGLFWGFIAQLIGGAAIAVGIPVEAAIVAGVGIAVGAAYLGYMIGAAIHDAYTSSQIEYSDQESTDNPISDSMEKRVPNSELNPPKARGDAPTSKKDGKPIEVHHKGQNPDGPFEELSRTDHRLGRNYKDNHPDFKEKSKIDRDEFTRWKKRYWKSEWDSGRFNSN